ncbi:NB-ARC domain protein [Mycoavidus cysteinexigens]|uniref:NB-ARC domain protein n=1 Tax=Mycoavidus cysteinexigens TaxID=1553431 RepID=A0A2Z6EWE4_9BURK|nr:NACHT domain-containing protein [Mycoavidus cysteinexigens]BBE09773.1 NB-ARC domain protein [Mycoavidus cysteinexigens]GAM53885.1 hypothetical protein EBME_2348 [bacterium endosymbiont of Mortierella elongata FMR23-6]GLR01086.1 hypothetical protein GCM10007934_08980 [Mycoavidus cysteinexigens]
MLPISGSNAPLISNASTRPNLLTRVEAIHEQASGEGRTIVQASENCVVSNQASGDNNVFTTYIALTASDSNAKLVFEKLNTHAEATSYKPLAQLGTQIEELRAAYFNVLEEVDEIRDGLALYVPSEGQETADSKTSFPLIDKVREFLSSNKKVLLLLGEAGSGKSTFNRHVTRLLWDEYHQSSTTPIPIFIELAEHKLSSEDLIESYLLKQDFSPESINELRKEKRLVFILDGFDEIQDRTQAFYIHNKLDYWKNAQVIISSRPEDLGENYRTKFQRRGQTSALQEYWLSPTSDDWITAYIQKYIRLSHHTGWDLKRYQEALNNLPTLKEATRRPFLLRMALDLLPNLSRNESVPITRIALYDEFISRWWNRSEERLQHVKLTKEEKDARIQLGPHLAAEGLKASQEMALALTQNRLVQASYNPEKGEVAPETWRTYLNKKDAEKRLLLFNAPLIHQGQHYRFIHKSIQDYCVARAICSPQFNGAQPDVNAVLNQFLLVDESLILDFLVERVKQYSAFKAYLYKWIEASKDRAAAVTMGAANAITILVRAGVQFNGADLKGIQIPGADLREGEFDSAQLQGSDLRNVKLRNSWLRNANLSGSEMAGVQFGEWPFLKEKSGVRICAYSPDGKSFAVGLDNGAISIYATSSWENIPTLSRHNNCVVSLAYSPNSEQIASGSNDRTVRLWDARSGQLSHTLCGHINYVQSVVYSPSGRQIASGSWDWTVRLWDARSGQLRFILNGHTDSVTGVAYSPNGEQIASRSEDKTVRLWDAQSGQLHHILSGQLGPVFSVAYSPNGNQIVSCGRRGVRLWDTRSGQLRYILSGHTNSVIEVAYSPNGDQIASGSTDNTVRLWDARSGHLRHTLSGHAKNVTKVVYSPNGAQIASCSDDKTVRLWDTQSGQFRHILSGHTHYIMSVVYSPSGKQIASSSLDKTVRLWDAQSDQLGRAFIGHTNGITSVAYSPNGAQIASGSDDKTVRLWDARSGQLRHTLSGHTDFVRGVVYSPSGEQIISGSFDNTVRLWDVRSGQLHQILTANIVWVTSVAYSPRGDQIAAGGVGAKVFLLDAQSGELRHTLSGHTNSVNSVAYSPNGAQIASGSEDRTVRLWDAQSGEIRHILSGHTSIVRSVMYSPHGNQIASGSEDRTVRLWDTQSGELHHTLRGHTGSVDSVAYSPNGEQIASGSYDQTVRLWNVTSGQCQGVIRNFKGSVKSVAWKATADDNYLVTGCEDRSVRQWKVERNGEQYKLVLCWSSTHEALIVTDTSIENVQGLSCINSQLLKQRGAIQAKFSKLQQKPQVNESLQQPQVDESQQKCLLM